MAIFNSYVSSPEGTHYISRDIPTFPVRSPDGRLTAPALRNGDVIAMTSKVDQDAGDAGVQRAQGLTKNGGFVWKCWLHP